MRAGQLLSPTGAGNARPATIASGLLALTSLEHAALAVAFLVDLWSDSTRSDTDDKASTDDGKVSTETAILVIDAALQSPSANAQLVAAELLCRNSKRLDPGQSFHWPSSLEGRWNPNFSQRTKLLIVEAIVKMTLTCDSTETTLRSAAVRLYGIWCHDPDPHVKRCIGKPICALIPRLKRLCYEDLIQGNQEVMLSQLEEAAQSEHTNPDRYLDRLSTEFAEKLGEWASNASGLYTGPGCFAAGQDRLEGIVIVPDKTSALSGS
jgi:hypothetical protein